MPATRTADHNTSSSICSTCGKSFSGHSALHRHAKLHSGEREYKCKYCSRTFVQGNHLKTHIASKHELDEPYKCKHDGCDRGFNDPSLRTRHYIRDHDASTTTRTHLRMRRSPKSGVDVKEEFTSFDSLIFLSPQLGADAVKAEKGSTSVPSTPPFALDDLFPDMALLDEFFARPLVTAPSVPSPAKLPTFGAVDGHLHPNLNFPSDTTSLQVPPFNQLNHGFDPASLPVPFSAPLSLSTLADANAQVLGSTNPLPFQTQQTFPQLTYPSSVYDVASQPDFGMTPGWERMYAQTQAPLFSQPLPNPALHAWYPVSRTFPRPAPLISSAPIDTSIPLQVGWQKSNWAQEMSFMPADSEQNVFPPLTQPFNQTFNFMPDTEYPFAYPSY